MDYNNDLKSRQMKGHVKNIFEAQQFKLSHIAKKKLGSYSHIFKKLLTRISERRLIDCEVFKTTEVNFTIKR